MVIGLCSWQIRALFHCNGWNHTWNKCPLARRTAGLLPRHLPQPQSSEQKA